ncbi:hypothetical protein PCASD_21596 [Puccinia coronata f. sp. avenae]|uniref:Uncharacterized protein n=1 Tax=Puccinia coronata f. sp. avenae TaxID=200324 RepID=A0A2N5SWF5_9BASI|nr:hypothetical protein PCASD_21596 [Puccinia coronata f. sp. avenae]
MLRIYTPQWGIGFAARGTPKKEVFTLRANPISWYSLAHSLFTGTYATGVNAVLPGATPPEQLDNEETSGVTPQLSKRRLLNKKEVKDNSASSSDDAVVVQPGRRTAPKRIRSSKYKDFKAGVKSIVGAIWDVGSHKDKKPTIKIKDNKNKTTVEKTSVRQKALYVPSRNFDHQICQVHQGC